MTATGLIVEFVNPDPRYGTLTDANLYGKTFISVNLVFEDPDYIFRLTYYKDGSLVTVDSGDLWVYSTDYILQVTMLNDVSYYICDVTILNATTRALIYDFGIVYVDKNYSDTLKVRMSASESVGVVSNVAFDNFKVWGNRSDKVWVKSIVKVGPGYDAYATPSTISSSTNNYT